jgi:hypothetical protein
MHATLTRQKSKIFTEPLSLPLLVYKTVSLITLSVASGKGHPETVITKFGAVCLNPNCRHEAPTVGCSTQKILLMYAQGDKSNHLLAVCEVECPSPNNHMEYHS